MYTHFFTFKPVGMICCASLLLTSALRLVSHMSLQDALMHVLNGINPSEAAANCKFGSWSCDGHS